MSKSVMIFLKRSVIPLGLSLLYLLTTAFVHPRPNQALALLEGRTYDQAHDSGYIDWSRTVNYVNLALPSLTGKGKCATIGK